MRNQKACTPFAGLESWVLLTASIPEEMHWQGLLWLSVWGQWKIKLQMTAVLLRVCALLWQYRHCRHFWHHEWRTTTSELEMVSLEEGNLQVHLASNLTITISGTETGMSQEVTGRTISIVVLQGISLKLLCSHHDPQRETTREAQTVISKV